MLTPLLASGAPVSMDFKVLIDADNNEATGCTVVTTAGLMKGVDHVLTTSVSFDSTAGTAAVTGVTRQTCTSTLLNNFSAPIPVDTTGWPVGVGPGGILTIETHIPNSALGGVTNMHLGFTAVSGNLVDGVILDDDGTKIIWPPLPGVRRHAAGLATTRVITLDGADGDWVPIAPIVDGNATASALLRFLAVRTYMNASDLYFDFTVQSNKNAPTANDDSYSVERGKSLGVNVPGVLANDTDPNGKPLTAILISGSGTHHGALTLNADGSFNYQNDGSPAPSDSFEYKANNGSADSNAAHVDISITEPNAGPPPVKPAFTSANKTCFTVGTQKTFTITTTPLNPAVTVTKQSGTLPNGLSFNAAPGSGTGQIIGMPASGTEGSYALVFRATNAVGFTDQNFTLSVIAPPPITPSAPAVCANSTGNTASGPAGMASYSWSISNGTITAGQTAQTVTWTAGSAGTATLTLTVTNTAGCSATNNANVTVNASPATPTITPSSPAVCAGSTGNTASGPAGATTYSWSIANGAITSGQTAQTVTWTAGVAGTTTLTLTVTNAGGCSATNSANVTVNANPATPTITPSPAQVCASSTGNTAAGPAGATTYSWSIVNGAITSGQTSQTVTYTAGASGTVGLTLVVTNAAGCSATNSANVPINANPSVPTITPSAPAVCASSTGNTASGPAGATTYSWSISNGTITAGQTAQTVTWTAGSAGTATLTLTVTNAAGCSATNNANVTVNANPATPTITPSAAAVCANSIGNTATGPAGATTYFWSIANGNITAGQTAQTVTWTAGVAGTTTLTLTVTNAAGCSATNSANVTVNANPSTPTITPAPPQVCANSTGNTAAGPAGAATYSWSIVNGAITSGQTSQTVTYTAGASGTTDLTLVVTNAAGCSATNTVNVTINANPAVPTITPSAPAVCANSTGNTASGPAGATTYSWSITNGIITAGQTSQTVTWTAGVAGTTMLTLTVTNAAGCSATNNANVTVNANPSTPTITPAAAAVCAGSTGNTANGPAGATTYFWSISNGNITGGQTAQTVTWTAGVAGTTTLTLTVTNAAGCSATNSADVTVNANPATPTITPSAAAVCDGSTGNTADGPAGATTYFWSITNGIITAGQTAQTVTWTAGVAGTTTLTLTVTNAAGCSATNNADVVVNANPATPTITPAAPAVCAGSTGNTADGPAGATTYFWSITNGSITAGQTSQTVTWTAGSAGTTTLTLMVTNAAGCSATNSADVTVNSNPATPTITPSAPAVCAGSTGNTANGPAGATTYSWSITNGSITAGQTSQTVTWTAGSAGTTTLTLTVTNGSGCPAVNNANVTVNANPATPTITPAAPAVCAGSTGNTADGPAGATTYFWSITNGNITGGQTAQTVTWTAGVAGTTTLTLTVTNAAGCSATNNANVTVNANPATPTITPAAPAVCAGSTGNTADGPAGATTYFWSITNGNITGGQTAQTVTWTAGVAGTTTLTLTVTNAAGCSATNNANVTVNANPATPTITPAAPAVCAGSTGNTANGPAGATTYFWSITNGNITGGQTAQTVTWTAGVAGTTTLTLTVTNAAGCSATNNANVTVNANPATPTITPAAPAVCAGSTGNTADGPAGATTYFWSITNGNITGGQTAQTVTWTAGAAGTTTLTLTVTNAAGCSATNNANVTVNANPATPTITPSPAQVCANSTGNTASGPGGATTYFWSITNGAITGGQTSQTVTYTAGASGTVGLTLIVSNGAGCSAMNTVNVTINANPSTPTITPNPAQVCADSTGNTADGPAGATTYFWSITNGAITGGQTSQTVTYTAGSSGVVGLTLVVTNAAGCSASNSANVTINPSPSSPTITPSASGVCAGSTGNTALGPAGATTYSWSITNGTITSGQTSQTVTWTAGVPGTTTLTLTVTNGSGCPATNSADVVVNANPSSPTITPASSPVCPSSTGNTASGPAGATTYSWSITNGSITAGQTSQTVTFTAAASGSVGLTLVVTNAAGCSATNSLSIPISSSITPARAGGGSFPAGTVSSAYTGQSFTASGGTGPYTFAVTGGTFPTNLSLAANGTISGTPTATGTFVFTVTATDANNCTGSASFSIAINPSAVGDSYSNLVNNTEAYVQGGTTAAPATPAVVLTGAITANDLPSGGVAVTAGTFSSANGTNNVVLAADGTFKYTPPVTLLATDTFNYTITSNTGGTGTPTQATGTVTLNLANRVWYVKNNGAAGNGQSQSPFNTLAAAQAASAASDIIFVYNGDGTTTGQNAGITLKANQQLIGEGVALVVNSNTLVVAGTKPTITNTAATSDVVTLNDGNTVKGLTVNGTAGARDGISSVSAHAGFTADTITVQNNVNVGVDLISMTGTVTITNSTISTVGNQALTINNGTAAVTVNNTNTINGGTGTAVSVLNRPAAAGAIAIGATLNNGQIQILSNTSGTISFTGTQTLSNATVNGVTMTTNAGATINFSGTLNVTTTTGVPFQASGGGTLNVTGTANLTAGAAANGLSLNGITIGGSGVTFTSVNTTGATTGINLVNFATVGTVTVNGGTITNGTTGISLQGTNTSLSLAGVTITGPTTGITNTTNFGTLTIGASVNVSAVTALNLTAGAVSGTFANVSSTGGTNGVNLSAVTGTWGVTAGTLTGAAGSTFNATGTSTGTVSWGGAITQANAANVVTISGSHTGNITFSGHVTTSGTSTGINISGSSGTYNFSDGTANASTIGGSGGGIAIAGESGSVSFGAGYTINAATTSFKISGTTTANITYSGLLTNNGNNGILLDINNATAGTYTTGTINFNGTATPSLSVNNAGNTAVSSVAIKNMQSTLTINHMTLTETNNNYSGTLVNILGTNTGGSLTFNNLALSASGGNNTGKGLTMAAGSGGTLAITATGGNSSISVGSSVLSLDGTGNAITLSASALQTGTSLGNGTASGILLTNVTGGTLTISGGSLTGVAGAGTFVVSGGSVSVTDGGTISQANGAAAVSIASITGGTLSFTNNITKSGTAANGISITSCSGGTISFTGATLSLSSATANAVDITGSTTPGPSVTFNASTALTLTTTSGTAFNASNASQVGTIVVTGSNNTITTTSSGTAGAGVNIKNMNIGASGVTFKSVTVNNGGVTPGVNGFGIAIDTTGASGSFSVTGNTVSVTEDGSGGTISWLNGADSTTGGNGTGIYLNSTKGPSFKHMALHDFQNYAVMGNSVNGFTLQYCTINGANGNNNSSPNTEGSVRFLELTGSADIKNSHISGAKVDNINVTNALDASTLNRLTIDTVTFGTNDATTGNSTVNVAVGGAGTLNMTVNSCTFSGSRSVQMQYTMNAGTPHGDVIVTNNTINDSQTQVAGAAGIYLTTGGAGSNPTLTYNIDTNIVNDMIGSGIAIGKGTGTGTVSGTINNNTITGNTTSGGGNGIQIVHVGGGTETTHITGNTIHKMGTDGILVQIGDNTSGGNGTLNATITGNTVNQQFGGFPNAAFDLNAGTTSSPLDAPIVCLSLGGAGALKNTFTASTGGGFSAYSNEVRLRQRFNTTTRLPGYAGATTDDAAVATFEAGQNTTTSGASSFVVSHGTNGATWIGGAACP